MADPPSEVLGALVASRYRIDKRVGSGGMGVVYRAIDERLGRAVALKVVSKKAGPSAIRRLQREARAVASLEHRGIVTLFDVVDVPDMGVVLVMELVRGESLRALLAADPRARAKGEVARIVVDVAESLGAAHRAGLVHRDVKPDNVMLRPDGRTALLDFGIAKAMTDRTDDSAPVLPSTETADTAETEIGAIVGTPAYLAPEQAMASEVSAATDQFALAVVAFELLTGLSPWHGAGRGQALFARIVGGDPAKASAARADLGLQVDAVLERALQKKPANRFPSIEAFASALAEALGGTAASPSATESPGAAVAVPGLPYAETQIAATDQAQASSHRARRQRKVTLAAGTLLLAVAGAAVALWLTRTRVSPTSNAAAGEAITYARVPMSPTKSPEAAKAFRDAMIAYRDADQESASNDLDEAIKLDPAFASAHLQRALLSRISVDFGASHEQAGRADYVQALRFRDALPPRDEALVGALEPILNRVPADLGEGQRRLEQLVSASAGAELWHLLGVVQGLRQDPSSAIRSFQSELAADPRSAIAISERADVLASLGEQASARSAYEECLRVQPGTSNCRVGLLDILDQVGACDARARQAAEFAALEPTNRRALIAKLRSDATLRQPDAVLLQEIDALPAPMTATATARGDKLNLRTWLAELSGSFQLAEDYAHQLEDQTAAKHDTVGFAYARQVRIIELREAGEDDKALDLARTYEATLAQLPPPDATPDVLPFILAFLARHGVVGVEELRAKRRAWLDRWLPQNTTSEKRFIVWISAYASPAETPEEAREALDAIHDFVESLPSPTVLSRWNVKEAVVKVLVLARRPEARAFLDVATRLCTPNYYGTREHYWSGIVDEEAGDHAAACADYARVLDRWGHATPRSVTADASRARMRALGCGVDGGR